MDTETALDFLRRHQPLPDDAHLDDTLIQEFEAVRHHFTEVRDRRCVGLLLNSFGKGSGFGTYQLVEDALRFQDHEAVAEELPSAIRSSRGGVRGWSVEIAADYVTRPVVEAVKDVWSDLDSDRRFWAAVVLRRGFSAEEDGDFLRRALAREDDADVHAELVQIDAGQ